MAEDALRTNLRTSIRARGIYINETKLDEATLDDLIGTLLGQRVETDFLAPQDKAAAFKTFAVSVSDVREIIHRLAVFLAVGRHSRLAAASQLADTYPDVSLFVPSLVDFDEWIDKGTAKAPVTPGQQILLLEQIARLSILDRLPAGKREMQRVHPFVAFDPLREISRNPADYSIAAPVKRWRENKEAEPPLADAWWERPVREVPTAKGSFETVRVAIEKMGFIGVKLYPPVGFKASGNGGPNGVRLDAALHRLFSYCSANDVPVMAHCGSSNAFSRDALESAHPRNWADTLETYPKLRFCFGHLGHSEGVEDPPDQAHIERGWAWNAVQLMRAHPNVFADLGNTTTSSEAPYLGRTDRAVLKAVFKIEENGAPVLPRRLTYGSDWFMNTLLGDHADYYRRMSQALARVLSDLPGFDFKALVSENALQFLFGPRGSTNKNRARLIAYYERHGARRPAWL